MRGSDAGEGGAMSFEDRLEHARRVEQDVAAWLMRRNWLVLPVYDYSGQQDDKAPKLQAARRRDSLVAPDLLAARGGAHLWFEVKWKAAATLHRKTDTLETGLNLRHWRDYVAIKRESGADVWIVFVHEAEAEIRAAEVSQLARSARIYDGAKMGRGGMVFFPYRQIKRLCSTRDVLRGAA